MEEVARRLHDHGAGDYHDRLVALGQEPAAVVVVEGDDHGRLARRPGRGVDPRDLGLDAGVNITVGLPVIRTSVDHGTAFDIAGTGRADEASMVEALRQAVELAPRRGGAGARRENAA